MPTLTERVFAAANNHKAELPGSLYNNLVAYKDGWANARTDQEQKKGIVEDNRGERDTNRLALELALLTGIHTTGAIFPGDVARCSQYFNFSLLFTSPKHKHETFTGTLLPLQQKAVVNRIFPTTTTTITIRNIDDNANLLVWLGTAENETPPTTAVEIPAGQHHDFKPSDLGNAATNSFLILKNSSNINNGDYEVEIVGG